MGYLFALLAIVVNVLKWAFIIRLVFDWIQMFTHYWRPRGITLVIASGIYAVTDPPLNFLRRKIPPLNLGGISLDLGFVILLLGLAILYSFLASLTFRLS